MVVDLKDIIAPHFWNIFNSRKPYIILTGGRGSTKTSMCALKICYQCIAEEKCSAIILRKYQNTLRNSVFKEIGKAFSRLGLIEGVDYTQIVSPMEIRLYNGNTIYFAGMDDVEKLKGFVDKSRPIKVVWFEEASEFDSEDDFLQVVATFSRGNTDYFTTLFSYNPPKNKFSFINEWCEKMATRDDVIVSHSDYRTVPREWLGNMFIEEAERLKKVDEKRYNWIYLGEVIGIEGLIFNYDLIQMAKEEDIKDLKCLYIDLAMDVGYSTSATTCIAMGYMSDGNWYLLDTYYSSPQENIKKSPSELSKDIFQFRVKMQQQYKAPIDKETCDSAETALVLEMFKDYGVSIHKVDKGTDKQEQIDFAQDFLSKMKFKVVDNNNNKIFLKEIKNYKWKKDSVEKGKPVPDKEEKEFLGNDLYFNTHSNLPSYYYADHTVDAWIYWVLDNKTKLNIKF